MAKGGPGVVIVESGGLPVTQVTGGGNAAPFTVVTGNGFPVTLVSALGTAVALYNLDGTEYSGFSLTAPVLAFASATDPDSDNTQDLLIDIADPGVEVDDEIVCVAKIGADFTTVLSSEYDIIETYTVVLGDLTDFTGEITMTLTPDGVAYLRAFHKRGSTYSGPSPTISKTISTYTPTYYYLGF